MGKYNEPQVGPVSPRPPKCPRKNRIQKSEGSSKQPATANLLGVLEFDEPIRHAEGHSFEPTLTEQKKLGETFQLLFVAISLILW
jgi:hypothetical protein